MVSDGLIIASEVTGFISFFLTALTWLGVYISLFTTSISAPKTLPLILGNLRQEILSERSLMRVRIKQGDQFHVWPGRQFHKVGNEESHIRLAHDTLKRMWTEFRDIERLFVIGNVGDAEDGTVPISTSTRNRNKKRDHDGEDNSDDGGTSVSSSSSPNEKAATGGHYHKRRIGDTGNSRRLSRRNSTIKSRMLGICEAGLSVDRRTYYNTDMYHRFLFWWKKSDIQSLTDRIQKMQIRRMERDLFETDELVKRGLQILGDMSGRDVWYGEDLKKGRGPDQNSHRRKRNSRQRRSNVPPSRAASVMSTGGARRRKGQGSTIVAGDGPVREYYEKETYRVRDRDRYTSEAVGVDDAIDGSESEISPRHSRNPSRSRSRPRTGAGAGAGVSANTAAQRRRRRSSGRGVGDGAESSTAPVEQRVDYEVISPGRVYISRRSRGDDDYDTRRRSDMRGSTSRRGRSVYEDVVDDRDRSYSRERDRDRR